MSRNVLASLAAVVQLSCGTTGPPSSRNLDSGLPPALITVLNDARGARSLYSFRYINDERVLYVHVPAYRSDLSCATFGDTRGATEVWYLEIFVKWPASRDTATLAAPVPFLDSYVDIVRADSKSRSHWIVFALGGTVSFESAPVDEQDQKAGKSVKGHLELSLPREPRAEGNCSGEASEGGTLQQCTCTDLQGRPSTCTKAGVTSCCETAEQFRATFSLDFSAESCGILCTTTPGGTNACSILQ
jgi:hypothetical protein